MIMHFRSRNSNSKWPFFCLWDGWKLHFPTFFGRNSEKWTFWQENVFLDEICFFSNFHQFFNWSNSSNFLFFFLSTILTNFFTFSLIFSHFSYSSSFSSIIDKSSDFIKWVLWDFQIDSILLSSQTQLLIFFPPFQFISYALVKYPRLQQEP